MKGQEMRKWNIPSEKGVLILKHLNNRCDKLCFKKIFQLCNNNKKKNFPSWKIYFKNLADFKHQRRRALSFGKSNGNIYVRFYKWPVSSFWDGFLLVLYLLCSRLVSLSYCVFLKSKFKFKFNFLSWLRSCFIY